MAQQPLAEAEEQFYERVLELNAATLDAAAMTLGHRLGFYEALDRLGSADSEALAAATDTGERYVREWLAHQAVAGILEAVEDGDARTRRYRVPPAHRAVLTDQDSPYYRLGGTQLNVGLAGSLGALEAAFQEDVGVPPDAYSEYTAAGASTANRPVYVSHLIDRWLPGIPALHARLGEDPPARIADIGCGSGWALISLAKAYPNVTAEGIDLDQDSIDTARANAEVEGVADRVSFEVRDAGDPQLKERYDLVTLFESLHHFPDPAGALRTLRGLLRDDGSVLLTEMRCEEGFTAPGDARERLYHGWSVLNCLPKSRMEPDAAAPGAVLRPAQVKAYGLDAGFGEVDPLDLDDGGYFWRFYRLVP